LVGVLLVVHVAQPLQLVADGRSLVGDVFARLRCSVHDGLPVLFGGAGARPCRRRESRRGGATSSLTLPVFALTLAPFYIFPLARLLFFLKVELVIHRLTPLGRRPPC